MKFLLILSCLVLYVALTCAQRCRGLPRRQDCNGGRHDGVSHAHHCTPDPNNSMWYYNHQERECKKMSYKGCGGNNNRYCTKSECDSKCPHPRN